MDRSGVCGPLFPSGSHLVLGLGWLWPVGQEDAARGSFVLPNKNYFHQRFFFLAHIFKILLKPSFSGYHREICLLDGIYRYIYNFLKFKIFDKCWMNLKFCLENLGRYFDRYFRKTVTTIIFSLRKKQIPDSH
jgi:hypothetical protein